MQQRIVQRCFLVFILLTAQAADSFTQSPAVTDNVEKAQRYRIGYQDVLDIQVFRRPELTQRVSVAPNGTITLFQLERPVLAVCKTDRELAADIATAYREKYLRDPQVNVVVAEQRSQPIAIIGAVEKPGSYLVSRRIHLLELLAMAGGPNKDAGTRLIIARTGNMLGCKDGAGADSEPDLAVIDMKLRDIQEAKNIFWLEPGDVVSILDSDVIYVYGNVNKQGTVRVREPITLTQAIVSSEGLKQNAKKERIRVLRQVAGSTEREELIYDLGQIDKGKIPDPYLEPNDIVAVSEDRVKTILQGLSGTIRSTIPSAIYRIP